MNSPGGCGPGPGLREPLLGYKPHRLNSRLNQLEYTNTILGTHSPALVGEYFETIDMMISVNVGQTASWFKSVQSVVIFACVSIIIGKFSSETNIKPLNSPSLLPYFFQR